jgi:DNA-binding CsgD family transcriptional regulator/tetratricopeptide (TPR) repeat protein
MTTANAGVRPPRTMPLVERESHLALLRASLDDAIEGAGQLVLIRGEAGIGKTALLRAFLDEARPRATVAIGFCDRASTPRPFSPLYDMSAALGHDFADLVDHEPTQTDVRTWMLNRLAGGPPTVIAIDDLHSADDATLDLTRFLARRIESTRAVTILTYREGEGSPALGRLLGELATLPAVIHLPLDPLSLDGVSRLATGSSVDAAELYRLTGGNPFFVTEALAGGASSIPVSVRDAIRARIGTLGEAGLYALEAAAVLGPRMEPWLLAAVAGERVLGVDEALAAGLLVKDVAELAFRHELTRVAVLDDLPVVRGIGMHRSALAVLRRAGSRDDARLAYHAEGAADAQAVVEHAIRAGNHALEIGAYREAIAQLERARRFGGVMADEDRAELLEALGQARMVTAYGSEAEEAWSEALELRREQGDPRQVGDLLRLLARAASWLGQSVRARSLAREAVDTLEPLGDSHELGMAYSMLSGRLMIEQHNEEAIRWGTKALAVAETLADDEVRAHALNNIGSAQIASGDAAGFDTLEASLEIARSRGYDDHVYRALFNLGASASATQQLTRANAYFDDLEQFSQRSEVLSCNIDANRADVLLSMGRWDEAAVAAQRAVATSRLQELDPLDLSSAKCALARLAMRRGAGDAAPLLAEAQALVAESQELSRQLAITSARAELAWVAGDLRPALPAVQRVYELAIERGDAWAIGELGRWLWRGGLLAKPDPRAAPPYRLEMEGDWRAAAAEWTERGNPYEAAITQLGADDPAAVRRAYDALRALGADAALPRAVRRLRELGAATPRGPRQTTQLHPAGLTEREAEVAELAAAGLTNREIADRLTLTEKTVSHHVSAVLGKLGARRRAEIGSSLPRPHEDPAAAASI